MTIYQKVEDVYFDAMHLAEALKAIPPECDCGDGHAHLEGECCCAAATPSNAKSVSRSPDGCLMHLSKLNESLRLLTEDVPRQRRRVETNEMPPDLYRQLVGIEILLGRLESMVNVLKQQLEQFRVNCAHQELQRIKERGAELGHLVARLNERL